MRAAAIFGIGSPPRIFRRFEQIPNTAWLRDIPETSIDADAVAVFGGDGTLHRHLDRLVKLRLPVLVVPCGSGNDFARSLGINSGNDALKVWERFAAGSGLGRDVDLGRIGFMREGERVSRYFCCTCGVGLDAEVARRANALPAVLRRNGGYAWSLLPALARFRPPAVKLTGSDGSTREKKVFFAAIANTPYFGGGMKVAPRAKLDDGLLDVCVVGEMSKFRLLRNFPKIYSGRHLGVGGVSDFQTESVRVETDGPQAVYADGEYVGETPVQATVVPKALRVIVGT
jgi:diacylglycerol kinase (ATP)